MDNAPLIAAVLGFLTALVGLATALLGRRKEIVHRHEIDHGSAHQTRRREVSQGGGMLRWIGCLVFVVGGVLLLSSAGVYMFVANAHVFPDVRVSINSDRLLTVVVTRVGRPVPNADVTVRSAFGRFIETRNQEVTGTTDGQGIFRAQWETERPDSWGTNSFRAKVTLRGEVGEFSGETSIFIPLNK